MEKVQAGYKVQPLSAFLKQPAPPAAPKIDFVPATTEGIKKNYFEYLDAALQFVPQSPDDKDVRAQARAASVSARARPSSSRTSRRNTRPPSCWA